MRTCLERIVPSPPAPSNHCAKRVRASSTALKSTRRRLGVGSGSGTGWINSFLHVVGSPIAVDGEVLVLDVNANRQLELSAVNATDGAVVWNQPFSASEITPGVTFSPTVIGSTVLVLSPAGSRDPNVKVEGVAVTTGKVDWSFPQPIALSDAPAMCGGGDYFCLAGFNSADRDRPDHHQPDDR